MLRRVARWRFGLGWWVLVLVALPLGTVLLSLALAIRERLQDVIDARAEHRITSYNVCYTKLLRSPVSVRQTSIGPSAGVAMVVAIASVLSERPARHNIGMTGERNNFV